jgi:hypothetical protein
MHLAQALLGLERTRDALPLADAARATYETAGPPPALATSLVVLGRVRLAMGDRAGALPDLSRAVEIASKALGADHPDTAIARRFLGEAQLANGKTDEAVLSLDQAMRALRGVRIDPRALADAALAGARARRMRGGADDEAAAEALCHEAEQALPANDGRSAPARAEATRCAAYARAERP